MVFLFTQYKYGTISDNIFFVVGPKQSNDAKAEEMNSLGRNEMYDENI